MHEYLSDDLASDSEDEKKIRKAESKAAKKRKSKQKAIKPATVNLIDLTSPKEVFRDQPLSARLASLKTDATSAENRGTGEHSVLPKEVR